jgi:hypothetical protein
MGHHHPSLRELGYFAEAAAALTLASTAVSLLPFRWVVRSMGGRDPLKRGQRGHAGDVRLAVQRASRRVPWRTVCMQEGLATHWLLRRRGLPSRLHYGIRKDTSAVKAHVWVTLNGEVVIGETHIDPHAPVACFPPG